MAVHRNLLIVEGKDDFHVMLALRNRLEMGDLYGVVDKDSVDGLLKSISAEIRTSGRECLGIVIDKDTDDASKNKDRWRQVKGILTPLGYTLPDSAPASGAILPSPELGFSKVGIWLMPNNQQPSMLEDFMRLLIPKDDECLMFAEETLKALEQKGFQRYKEVHRPKALMHTWIAWQKKPGIPLGRSTTAYLDTNTHLCQQFADWLNRLFNP